VVMLVGAAVLVWALVLVALTRHPARRRVLSVVAVVNTVAAGVLVGLAPSAPDGTGQGILVGAAGVVVLFAIVQGWARGMLDAPRA